MKVSRLLIPLAVVATALALLLLTAEPPSANQDAARAASAPPDATDDASPTLEADTAERSEASNAPAEGAAEPVAAPEPDDQGSDGPVDGAAAQVLDGITIVLEDHAGARVPDAAVVASWRAGWGDYKEFKGTTGQDGEMPTPIRRPFQLQDLQVELEDRDAPLEGVHDSVVADGLRTGHVRFELPFRRGLAVVVRDSAGEPLTETLVEFDRLDELPDRAGVNRLTSPFDERIRTDLAARVRTELDAGVYRISAKAPGESGTRVVDLSDVTDEEVEVTLRLRTNTPSPPRKTPTYTSPPAQTVSGQVVATLGVPIAGARVIDVVYLRRTRSGDETRADSKGRFAHRLRTRKGDRYLHVTAKGYAGAWVALPETGSLDGLVVRLEEVREIRAVVIDAEGTPVSGTAALFPPLSRTASIAERRTASAPAGFHGQIIDRVVIGTGSEGAFDFDDVSSEVHRIWFQPDDPALPAAMVEARGGDHDVVLEIGKDRVEAADLVLEVTEEPSGGPPPPLSVTLRGPHPVSIPGGSTDRKGRYVVRGLKPGRYHLTLKGHPEDPGSHLIAQKTIQLDLAPGENRDSVSVDKARALQLRLHDTARGEPLRGGRVRVETLEGGRVVMLSPLGYDEGTSLRVDGRGRVNLFGMPQGRFRLIVERGDRPTEGELLVGEVPARFGGDASSILDIDLSAR